MNDELKQVLSTHWFEHPTVHRVVAGETEPAIAPAFENFLRYATREMKDWSAPGRDYGSLVDSLRSTSLVWLTAGKKPGNAGWLIGENYVLHSPEGSIDWQQRSAIIPFSFITNADVKGGFSDLAVVRLVLENPKTVNLRYYFGSAHHDDYYFDLRIPLIGREDEPKLLALFKEILKLGRESKFELFDSANQPRILTPKWGTE